MSVDFTSDTGEAFFLSNAGWRYLVEVAKLGGFARLSETSDDGAASVSASAAIALADAIDRVIGAGDPAGVAARVSVDLDRLLVDRHPSAMFDAQPFQFDAKTILDWREFAAFARRGGFRLFY